MSKTKRHEKQSTLPWFLLYTAVLYAIAIYIRGYIPLYTDFYAKVFVAAIITWIIGAVFILVIKRHRLAGASMKKIDNMTGEEFEQYLGILYRRKGYKVEFTPGTMDFGADLILTKGRTKTIVQAKRYRNSVGEAAVQQAIAAMGYYKADQCMVVTNSDYTPAARELAKKTKVVLIDRNKLGKSAMYI